MIVYSHQPFKIKQTDCNLPDKKKSKYSVRRNPSRPLLLVLTFFLIYQLHFDLYCVKEKSPVCNLLVYLANSPLFLRAIFFFYPQNPDDFGDLSFRLLKPFNFMNMSLSYNMLCLEGALFNFQK